MFTQEVEGRRPIGLVGWGGCEVEGEEDVVDGRVCVGCSGDVDFVAISGFG